jgi:colanic acid/amylovoran biosynthesis glycosyltransferase
MAPKGDLILLTSTFPYGKGETFLESEVPILADEFERVFVVPCHLSERSANARPLPERVVDCAGEGTASFAVSVWTRHLPRVAAWALEEPRSAPRVFMNPRAIVRLQHYARTGVRIAARIESLMHAHSCEPRRTLVYSYWSDALAVGAALVRMTNSKVRCVARAHRFDLYAHADPVLSYLPFRAQISRSLDQVFFVSDHGRAHALRVWGLAPSRAGVHRLGVRDPGRLSRASYGDRSSDRLELLSCSAAIPVKQLDRIVSVLQPISAALPGARVRWTHIGDGPELDRLKALVRAAPAGVDARFLGHLTNSEVLSYYRNNSVDALVNTSRSEGVPVSMMEAFAHGVPVVAPAIDGIPEIVSAASGALFTPSASPTAIARAVVDVVSDSARHTSLRAEARAVFERSYDAVSNYREFAEALVALRRSTL